MIRKHNMRKLPDKAIFTNFTGSIVTSIIFVLFVIFVMSGLRIQSGKADLTFWFFLIFLLVVGLILGYAIAWVRLFTYTLEENEIKVEHGVISKSYDAIPYSRIQNVGLERGLLERMVGLTTVDIQTAGSSVHGSAEGKIPGITKQSAEKLRAEIMERVRDS